MAKPARPPVLPLLLIAALALFADGGQDPLKRFKIDSHFHFWGDRENLEKTAATYEKYNAMVCMVTPYDKLDLVKKGMETHPGVIVGLGEIDLDDPDAVKKIEAFRKAGFKGIGEMSKPARSYDDSAYLPVYAAIEKAGMHALFHTGVVFRGKSGRPEQSGMNKMRPACLDEIARRFPKMMIQGAHLGNPWYEEAAEAARWNPNLIFDVTGSTLLKKADDLAYFGRVLWWRPALETTHSPTAGQHAFEKIVFGTDEGPEGLEANIGRFEALLAANSVPEDVREMCWQGTLARILGIARKIPRGAGGR